MWRFLTKRERKKGENFIIINEMTSLTSIPRSGGGGGQVFTKILLDGFSPRCWVTLQLNTSELFFSRNEGKYYLSTEQVINLTKVRQITGARVKTFARPKANSVYGKKRRDLRRGRKTVFAPWLIITWITRHRYIFLFNAITPLYNKYYTRESCNPSNPFNLLFLSFIFTTTTRRNKSKK